MEPSFLLSAFLSSETFIFSTKKRLVFLIKELNGILIARFKQKFVCLYQCRDLVKSWENKCYTC